MSINEIENLIKKLVEAEAITDKDRKSLSSRIKRSYNIEKQELKSKGKSFSFESLNRLITILINNYEKIKDNDIINEVMQEIAEDYSEIMSTKRISQEKIERQKTRIYQHILGNPGTKTDGMTSEFIASIIRLKLTENDGINREDILNILAMQSKNMYQDIEEYQKLINDTIIAYSTYNPNGQRFTNPQILKIFESLAASYKISKDFDRVKEIYEQALKMKLLEDTPEYTELKKHYEEFLDFLEMRRNFEDRRFDSFDDLIGALETKLTENDIFVKGERGENPNPGPVPPNLPESSYVMPVGLKLEGFKRLVNSLKRINENFDITSCEIGKNAYNGYVIFRIEGTNISIFENFNEVNARVFIVKNELIDQVRQLSRTDATAIDGVEAVNHVSNFENYCKNLRAKVLKLIRETSPKPEHEDEEIKFEEEEQPVVPIIPIDMNEIGEEHPADEISEDVEEQSSGETSEDAEEQDSNIEEAKPSDPVEAERQKAYRFQAHLRELEAEIEGISREAEENINKIKEQKANIESGEEHK